MGQAWDELQLWVNDVSVYKTISLIFYEHLEENVFSASGINGEIIQFAMALFVKLEWSIKEMYVDIKAHC